jgi:hypothetical protein
MHTLARFNRAFAIGIVLNLLFDDVPDSGDPVAVRDYLSSVPGVSRVHDLFEITHVTIQVVKRPFTVSC